MSGVLEAIRAGRPLVAKVSGKNVEIPVTYDLTPFQTEVLLAGGLLNYTREKAS